MRQSDSSDKPPVYDQNRISVHDCTSFRISTFEDVPTVSLCVEGYQAPWLRAGGYRFDSFDSGDREGETPCAFDCTEYVCRTMTMRETRNETNIFFFQKYLSCFKYSTVSVNHVPAVL